MERYRRYTVTAALPYANGPLHIGHIAGAYLPADIYVRYLRLREKDVVFIGGSDEHGAAITIKAKKENTLPKTIVDKYHAMNKATFAHFGISFDLYHRTSSERHHKNASAYFSALYEKGVFVEKTSQQFYDETFQQFLADRYILGTCPKCHAENAYGDQCEKCGASINPLDLINPISALSNKPPVLRETTHWYLPLEAYQLWLEKWLNDEKSRGEKLKKNVIGQCNSWLKEGLHPRAITRDLDWGVKVPLADAKGKVLYVWLDAPIGYISATQQWAIDKGKDWKPYWQDKDTKLVHFIGKDNIVFHCIIFPAILKAHGEYILPTNVPANEFMNLEGQKISTSRNWAVWLDAYMDDFPDKQDVLRYVLCANAPETKDSEFRWKDFQAHNNNELVATLGNFVHRVWVLSHKYFEGIVQEPSHTFKTISKEKSQQVAKLIEQYKFRDAQATIMDLARLGNQHLAEKEPWKLFRSNPQEVGTILADMTLLVYDIAILISPFMPDTAQKIRVLLNLSKGEVFKWDNIGQAPVKCGHQLGKASLLFEKIEDEAIQIQLEKLHQKEKAQTSIQSDKSSYIQWSDFSKLDIRIGTIIEACKVPRTDKLLRLIVDLGKEKRTIVSGIASHYKTTDIVGQQVSVLCNLQPRKIKGILSQGMILMAENSKNNELVFVQPKDRIDNNSRIS